jgi:3',5'-cyclic AMP phosphodiesterase CpdA
LWGDAPLPQRQCTIEMWAVYHVDRAVGAVAAVRGSQDQPLPWMLSLYDWQASLQLQLTDGRVVTLQHRVKTWGGFKERWLHLVATVDDQAARLYLNGEVVATAALEGAELAWPDHPAFEAAAYMANEPAMELGDLVRGLACWDQALDREQILRRYQTLCQQVEQGVVYPEHCHFTAPPYLNLVTTNSVNLLWETDRETTAELRWGTTAELEQRQVFPNSQRLHETTLQDLEPNTTYFYRVTCQATGEPALDSGLLTFRTAVVPGQPFRFAILGDTESRPHVNRRLAQLIWDERPHFVVNLGDLTDAGMEAHRYEWTHEYFLGMGALHSRVPVFPVPGNGEGDLFWYRHYQRLPEPEGYYRFQYGDIDFFMLDSNRRETDFAVGGRQYEWLKSNLQASKAKWKIVCHHHATYTSEEDDYGDSWREASTWGDMQVRPMVPLCEEHGVDLMMFGHLHLYERSFPIREGQVDWQRGVVHLLAGGGGGNLEDFGPTPAWFSAKTYRGHHYVTCELQTDGLTFRMFDLDGRLRDQWQMKK